MPRVLSFLVGGVTGCGADPIIPVGASIAHDDFLYTAREVQTPTHIGTRTTSGRFYVVRFEVANRAARVSHVWGNRIAYMVDAQGRRYENEVALQRELERQHPFGWAAEYVTGAGSARETLLVFEVPTDAGLPLDLMVRGHLLMGDVLDGVRFRRTRVRLT